MPGGRSFHTIHRGRPPRRPGINLRSVRSGTGNRAHLDHRADVGVAGHHRGRAPAPNSSLVVTATGSPELQHLQRALDFIPLFQLVEDVVRSATATCWLGAPYWNTDAIDRLPRRRSRGSPTGAVPSSSCARARPRQEKLTRCRSYAVSLPTSLAKEDMLVPGPSRARSPEGHPLLLHAKFALADRRLGYLGSANMTGQGFGDHLEIGTRLAEVETAHLVDFLEALCASGLLQSDYL